MKIRWLLIDFDNTLMDTEAHSLPVLIERFNILYADKLVAPLTLSIFQAHFHGLSGQTLCDRMSAYFNIPVDYADLFNDREQVMQAHYQSLPSGVLMAPSVVSVLSEYQQQGMTLALVTNNPLQRAFAAMRCADNQQGAQLATLFGANFFEARPIQKPDPDVYLRALRHLNADPDQSIAIEDSPTGVQAARGAGLVTLGYVGLSPEPALAAQRLRAAGCKATFERWADLRQVYSNAYSPNYLYTS